jgi:hypothetical protein
MNKAYERYRTDEVYRASVLDAARRERIETIRRLIIKPLLALLKRPPLRQGRMLRRSAYS